LLTAGALGLLGISAAHTWHPVLFWNASDSMPRGLYVALPSTVPQVGDIVAARLPDHARALAAERRYLPGTIPVMKTVRAIAGATVCASAARVSVNGTDVATRLAVDSQGRILPTWEGCKILDDDEVFLLSDRAPASFDGRYFGPISKQNIVSRVRSLWTF
jgi:conjugative transfer signal peptidase TraF